MSEATAQTGADEAFDALTYFDDPAAAETALRALRAEAETAGEQGRLLEIDTQIARAQGLQGRFGAASDTLDAVKAALSEAHVRASIRHDLEVGRILYGRKQPGEARQHLQNAMRKAHAARQDVLAIDARRLVAAVEPDPTRQVGLGRDALTFAAASTSRLAQARQGALWRDVGEAARRLGRTAEADEAFEKAKGF